MIPPAPANRGTFDQYKAQQHIDAIAAAFRIKIVYRNDKIDSVARSLWMKTEHGLQPAVREIHIALVHDSFTYAIALHELGHFIHPSGLVPGANTYAFKMECELAAWEWAEHHALCWTSEMTECRRIGLESHIRASQQRDGLKNLEEILDILRGGEIHRVPSKPETPEQERKRLAALREFGRKLK